MFAFTPRCTPLKSISNSAPPPSMLKDALVATAPPPLIVHPWSRSCPLPYATTKSAAEGHHSAPGVGGVGGVGGPGVGDGLPPQQAFQQTLPSLWPHDVPPCVHEQSQVEPWPPQQDSKHTLP